MRFDGGWIKIHRALDSHWIGNDGVALAVFVKLVMWANREPTKLFREGKLITVERGQLLTSSYELAEKLGFERKTVERRLEAMTTDGTIVQKVSHRGRLITVCNYDEYQKKEKAVVPDLSQSRPTEGSTEDTTGNPTEGASNRERKNPKKERNQEEGNNTTPPLGVVQLAPVVVLPVRKINNPKKQPNPNFLPVAEQWMEFAMTSAFWKRSGSKWSVEGFALELEKVAKATDMNEFGISELLKFIQSDDFWREVAVSPEGLLRKSKNGLRKIDNILVKWRNSKKVREAEAMHKFINDDSFEMPF